MGLFNKTKTDRRRREVPFVKADEENPDFRRRRGLLRRLGIAIGLACLSILAGCGTNIIEVEIQTPEGKKARLVTEVNGVEFNSLVERGHRFNGVEKGEYTFTLIYGGYFEAKQCTVGTAPILPGSVKTYPVKFSVPSQKRSHPKGTIAFATDRDGSRNWEIYSMKLDGSGLTNLTMSEGSDTEPVWSPDGKKIAFVSNRNGGLLNTEIYVMDADGSNQTRLTFNPARDYSPTWSPDGTRIAFVSQRTGKDQIFVMDADGGNISRLSDGNGIDRFPAWSPDGKLIAFCSEGGRDEPHNPVRTAKGSDIYVMKPDGTEIVRLTQSREMDWHPSWSPDGMYILFDSSRKGAREIYIMRNNGNWQTRLTLTPEKFEWEPVWAPDGMGYLFAGNLDGNYDIYLTNLTGDELVNLTKSRSNERHPTWRPF